ncbi:alkaline phosphatase family protein [Microbacterium sp. A82]|uniref:alkaline phosphatase family protein n=1 Tax=unclassified Microbacterium TaxID=2609290 RepID=UPI003F2B4915
MLTPKRHLLLIGIDGLRVDRAFGTGLAPALDALAARGSMQPATVEGPTISGPSWLSILTAKTQEEHGVFDNTFVGRRTPVDEDLLARAWREDPAARTIALSSWPGIAHPDGPGPVVSTRTEQIDEGLHKNIVINREDHDDDPDVEVCRQALIELDEHTPDVAFVYFWMTDHVGHASGGLSVEYDEAIRTTDARVSQLLDAVERRIAEAGEEWLVAVTTDHGHRDEGGHGGDSELERRTFLLIASFGTPAVEVPAGIRPVEFSTLLLNAR